MSESLLDTKLYIWSSSGFGPCYGSRSIALILEEDKSDSESWLSKFGERDVEDKDELDLLDKVCSDVQILGLVWDEASSVSKS